MNLKKIFSHEEYLIIDDDSQYIVRVINEETKISKLKKRKLKELKSGTKEHQEVSSFYWGEVCRQVRKNCVKNCECECPKT